MHFVVAIDINSNTINGAFAGMATTAVIIMLFAALGATIKSGMSLGGGGGFRGIFFRGCRVGLPIGALIGGVVSILLPWPFAIPAVCAAFSASVFINNARRK